MLVRRDEQRCAARIVFRQTAGHAAQRPGARQVQPVQMHQLAVGGVAHFAHGQPVGRSVGGQSRKEAGQPDAIFVARQHAPHEIRFHQTGRQKVLARRFIADRAILVLAIKFACLFAHHLGQALIAMLTGIVQHQAEGESGLVMRALADRIDQLGNPVLQLVEHHRFQWLQILHQRRSRLALRPTTRRDLFQLGDQLQEPGHAIGTLETAPVRAHQIFGLGRDILSAQIAHQRRARLLAQRAELVLPPEPRKHPVSVHRAMPVETAIKGRMQLLRRLHIVRAAQHMADLVGILLVHAGQCQPGKALGLIVRFARRHRILLRRGGHRARRVGGRIRLIVLRIEIARGDR